MLCGYFSASESSFPGGRSRVSEVLNKKRKLTVEMMRSVRKHLAIRAESLDA